METVFAELTRGVALAFEVRRDDHDVAGHADRLGGTADRRQPSSVDALSGDEEQSTGGATLFGIAIGEQHFLLDDPIDVRVSILHQSVDVTAQFRLTDVVAPDN